MKINYKNTALSLLEEMNPHAFRICEDAEHSPQAYKTALGLSIVREWPKIVDRFRSKIRYISDPFYKAYEMGLSKLGNVIDAEEIDECGTMISRASQSETNTFFYDIATTGKGDNFRMTCVIFCFTKEANIDKPALAMYAQRNAKGVKQYLSETAVKNGVTQISMIADVFTLLLFLKYCDLQTKEIKPQAREWHIGTKYLNETKQKIEVLDSTWFTTITRSESFGVRGHFRMQPCGHNLSERKLIWVDSFEKQGYTRTAKILSQ